MGRKADEDDGDGDGGEKGFFACYLLTSLNPRFKGQTYIGFTVNPRRRIRQHNGEIGSGAWRTKTKRPWEMVLCIHGFPTNVSALKFEWAWQHPTESLAVRQAAASFKSLSGLPNKIKLAYTMLSLPAWNSLNITVNYFSTKYKIHSAGCPNLPEQMKVKICPMDELPCYSQGEDEHEYDCDDSLECDEDSTVNEISTVGTERDRHYKTSEMQTWDAPTSEKVSSPPFSYINSLAEVSSSVAVGTSNATVRAEDRDTFTWIEDNSKRQLRDSPEKDCTHPHSFNISSSVAAGASNATVTAEERDTFTWIEDYSKRQLRDSPVEDCTHPHSSIISPSRAAMLSDKITAGDRQATPAAAYEDEPSTSSCNVSREIEIIDLFTPSPGCRVNSCSKKRKAMASFPDIIDLTKSPLFIQL